MNYLSITVKLSSYSNEKITELLLNEKRNPGWTSSRAVFLTALKEVAAERKITAI